MKVLGSFVDCVCEPHLYKEDIRSVYKELHADRETGC